MLIDNLFRLFPSCPKIFADHSNPHISPHVFFHPSRYSPMDLSKNPETDNSASDVDEDEADDEDGAACSGDDNASSENDTANQARSIPSSFSIRNLSKPHVAGEAAAAPQGQVSEMKEYVMNTMRELLGIYGLTSEVAESISRQLPIAAFSSGELFLWLGGFSELSL